MSKEKQIAQVTKPIPMKEALGMYGVLSEEELKKLFDNLYLNSQRGFLSRIFTQLLLFLGFKKS